MVWKTIRKGWKKFQTIDDKWFYSRPPRYAPPLFLVFVKGDLIVLVPLCIIILAIGIFSVKLMLIVWGSYLTIRYFGEMIYWLHQQFGTKKYRPNDFGLKNLSNDAIYILYQTFATAWVVIGIAMIFFSLLYLK